MESPDEIAAWSRGAIVTGPDLRNARVALSLSVLQLADMLRLKGARQTASRRVRLMEEGEEIAGPTAVALEALVILKRLCAALEPSGTGFRRFPAGQSLRALQEALADAHGLLEGRSEEEQDHARAD